MPVELIVVIVAVLIVFSLVMAMLSRVKKCPSDKVMVIYGKVGKNPDGSSKSAKCIHGGAAFVLPLVQSYQYLDLTPISIQVDLTNALSRQNIRIDVPSRFTVGISTEQGIMQNAAERLLGLQLSEIQELSKDIIFGQLRLIIATMDIEEINTDRDKFLEQVSRNVETELKKIGLRLINVNVTDINDESGYIIALGKEAAAKAINDAKKSVAEQEREGAIGEANARMEQRIKVSEADSVAIQGENKARIDVAMSNAQLREKEAEASASPPRPRRFRAPARSRNPMRRAGGRSRPASRRKRRRSRPTSSCRPRSKSGKSNCRPRRRPKKSAVAPRVKRMRSTPRWRQRPRVSKRCSRSRPPALPRWSAPRAAIPTPRSSC